MEKYAHLANDSVHESAARIAESIAADTDDDLQRVLYCSVRVGQLNAPIAAQRWRERSVGWLIQCSRGTRHFIRWYGWLRKGFVAARNDPQFFLRTDAHVALGAGKNMARSIRYWCHAFKLPRAEPKPRSRSKASHTTAVGELLLGPNGFDPFLESMASPWYLHWQLLTPPCPSIAIVGIRRDLPRKARGPAADSDQLEEPPLREVANAQIVKSIIEKGA